MSDKDSSALDQIAKTIALDDDGCWSGMSGILENIGYIIMATGRKVEGWGE